MNGLENCDICSVPDESGEKIYKGLRYTAASSRLKIPGTNTITLDIAAENYHTPSEILSQRSLLEIAAHDGLILEKGFQKHFEEKELLQEDEKRKVSLLRPLSKYGASISSQVERANQTLYLPELAENGKIHFNLQVTGKRLQPEQVKAAISYCAANYETLKQEVGKNSQENSSRPPSRSL